MRVSLHGVRFRVILLLVGSIVGVGSSAAFAQQKASLIPTAKTVTAAEAVDLAKFDNQLIQVPAVKVVHADTAQVFMFGDKGHQTHVVIPAPAIDAANVGDVVAVTGFVRHYSVKDFERDYRWFKESDYPDVHGGDWVIVATSVQTPEGTQLVPGNTMSTTPPDVPRTKPEVKH
jgi:hypothetical protein